MYQLVLICALMNLLLQMCRSCYVQTTVVPNHEALAYRRIMAYLVAHCEETSLEAVAEKFNYHPNSVSAMIRKNTGKTFQQLRQQLRLF